MAASMSAGEMFKVPVTFPLPGLPKEKCPFFPDLPPGAIVQHSYGMVMIKYGICAEPFRLPEIARILPASMTDFLKISVLLRDAYFFTKVINIATISRKE
jgi:hypothetical protein